MTQKQISRHVIPAQPGFDLILLNASGSFSATPIVAWVLEYDDDGVCTISPVIPFCNYADDYTLRFPDGTISAAGTRRIYAKGQEMLALVDCDREMAKLVDGGNMQ